MCIAPLTCDHAATRFALRHGSTACDASMLAMQTPAWQSTAGESVAAAASAAKADRPHATTRRRRMVGRAVEFTGRCYRPGDMLADFALQDRSHAHRDRTRRPPLRRRRR